METLMFFHIVGIIAVVVVGVVVLFGALAAALTSGDSNPFQ